jgi:hypothetical protein
MSSQKVMVQIAEREWTLATLHQACTLARSLEAEIALVKMLPVQHLSWLGTPFGAMDFTELERAELRDYTATVEDYGVPFTVYQFQYFALAEALSDAADYVDAQFVFATLPPSVLPFWRQFQLKGLRRRLAHHGRQLTNPRDRLPSQFGEMASAPSTGAQRASVK